jgi:hypothetical protein
VALFAAGAAPVLPCYWSSSSSSLVLETSGVKGIILETLGPARRALLRVPFHVAVRTCPTNTSAVRTSLLVPRRFLVVQHGLIPATSAGTFSLRDGSVPAIAKPSVHIRTVFPSTYCTKWHPGLNRREGARNGPSRSTAPARYRPSWF